ncbi:MAG: hypothetical protein ACLTBV_11615 [Enterocloster bolteae]
MKKDRQRKAGFVKPLMTTVCIIGMATLSFRGLTQVVMAMETQKLKPFSPAIPLAQKQQTQLRKTPCPMDT